MLEPEGLHLHHQLLEVEGYMHYACVASPRRPLEPVDDTRGSR